METKKREFGILSFNINGLVACLRKRNLQKTHLKSFLDAFSCNIICVQETKLSSKEIDAELGKIEGWEAYYSSYDDDCRNVGASKTTSKYSGVATFCSSDCLPKKSQDSFFPDEHNNILPSEGRLLVTFHGRLAVVNVYCPAIRTEEDGRIHEERLSYKLKFNEQVQNLVSNLQFQGNLVIVVGDFNIGLDKEVYIPKGDPPIPERFRLWMNSFLERCELVDTFRYLNPEAKGAYTCWNSMTGGRQNNEGRRLDYILWQKNFKPIEMLLQQAEILKDEQGSDHCPVVARWKISEAFESSLSRSPSDVQPPSSCALHLPRVQQKQKRVTDFFSVSLRKQKSQKLCAPAPPCLTKVADKSSDNCNSELEARMKSACSYLSLKQQKEYFSRKDEAPLCDHK
eukprot:GHVP01032580.1.p1 GENE.GHVP01032580.1~~GHVP01032580.1.p1  ORF type:complete len:398 (+),score=73.53 GHVP01032580.1:764-1957(+)